MDEAWKNVTKNLREVMAGTKEATDEELKNKYNLLKWLSDFAITLRKRVAEQGGRACSIDDLFQSALKDRNTINEI